MSNTHEAIMRHANRTQNKIQLGELMKKYFKARDDFAGSHEDAESLDYDKETMDLYQKKIEHELFEMWKNGKIVVTFE